MKSPQQVKKDIPFLSKFSYWESTAVGPALRPVINAMVEYYEKRPFNYLVGECKPALETNAQVKKACESIAKLINAAPEEISLYPKNTSESISMVIEGLPWEKGDEVIGSNIDHLSTYLPILRLMEKKGIKFKMIKGEPNGWVDVKEYKKQITKKPKMDKAPMASPRLVLDQSFRSDTSNIPEARPRGGTISEKMEPTKDSAQQRSRRA